MTLLALTLLTPGSMPAAYALEEDTTGVRLDETGDGGSYYFKDTGDTGDTGGDTDTAAADDDQESGCGCTSSAPGSGGAVGVLVGMIGLLIRRR